LRGSLLIVPVAFGLDLQRLGGFEQSGSIIYSALNMGASGMSAAITEEA